MGLVDTLMVGPLGPEAIGAVGIGSSLFIGVVIFAMGLLLGLDTLVSQALRRRPPRRVSPVARARRGAEPGRRAPRHAPAVRPRQPARRLGPRSDGSPPGAALPEILSWSVLPLLFYATFRRYLQGMGVVRPVMIALVMANITNVVVNWVLIYGKLGAPAMGVRGSAWATVLSRVAMAAYLLRRDRAAGARPPAGAVRNAAHHRAGVDAPAARARRAGGVADHARGRRLCRVDRARRTADAGRARRAPDCDPHRRVVVHGAARRVVGRRRARRSRGRPPRSCRRPSAPAGPRSSSARVHGLHGRRVRPDPEGPDGRVHARRRRRCSWAPRCSPSRPSFSCSTASRAWRPASCAASATRARRCCGTSSATGSSACRAATCSASCWAAAWSDSGGVCRSA